MLNKLIKTDNKLIIINNKLFKFIDDMIDPGKIYYAKYSLECGIW